MDQDGSRRSVLVAHQTGANGCIEWTGLLTPCGYGRFWVGDTMRRAHRVVLLVHGSDVPSGMTVDHLCRNRRCVNPAHLEAVPSAVNTLRGRTLSAANKAKTHCARGHELSGKNLVWRSQDRRITVPSLGNATASGAGRQRGNSNVTERGA